MPPGKLQGASETSTYNNLSRAQIEALILDAEKSVGVVEQVLRSEASAGRLDADILGQLGFSSVVKSKPWSFNSLIAPAIFWGGSYLAYKFYRKRTKGPGVALVATAATVVPVWIGSSMYRAYKEITK